MNSMSPPRCHFHGLLLFIATLVYAIADSNASAAGDVSSDAKAQIDEGPVVALSPFEVTAEKLEFHRWLKLSSPHFILYTDVGSDDATELARQMEMMDQAVQFFLHRKSKYQAPLIAVLPSNASDWNKFRSRGGVEWQVGTSLVGKTQRMLLAQYDWQSTGLKSVWALLAGWEVEGLDLKGPLWFQRGLSTFFGRAEFAGDALTIGKISQESYSIAKYGWMDWPKFFSLTASAPEYMKDTDDHRRFEGQAAAFTHYILTQPDKTLTAKLLSWAAYLDVGNPPTEVSFKQFFQSDWKGIEAQIGKLQQGGEYKTAHLQFPPAALQFSVATTSPRVGELRELIVLAQILNQHTPESDISLDTLLSRGIKTPQFRELLADACENRKRPEPELQLLRQVITAGSSNPRVYSTAARLLFEKALPRLSLDGRVDEPASDIRLWCRRAIEIEPLDITANEILAWTEALAPALEKQNIETILEACRRLEGNAATDEVLSA